MRIWMYEDYCDELSYQRGREILPEEIRKSSDAYDEEKLHDLIDALWTMVQQARHDYPAWGDIWAERLDELQAKIETI